MGGIDRQYLIDFPSEYDDGTSETYPLLVALHGGTGTAREFSERNGFVNAADREGFVVVHPDGMGLTENGPNVWNVGYFGDQRLTDANDYTFIARLVSHLVESYRIDGRRVYLVGHSNGAMLTHEVAARYPELFAAVGPVAGPVGGYRCKSPERCEPYTPPEPANPVPVVVVHGTADKHVPYDGGRPETSIRREPRYDFSVQETIDWWRRHNKCQETAQIKRSSGRINRITYPCGDGTIDHLRFDGVGHFWGEFDRVVGNQNRPEQTLAGLLWTRLRKVGE